VSPEETISAAFMAATKKRPYFATGLTMMVRRLGPVGTMAVNAEAVLVCDPQYLASTSIPELAEDLIHEYLHLQRRHHTRAKAIKDLDPKLWNYAADFEINDDLDQRLLGGGVFPETYGLERGLMAEEYYAKLRDQAKGGKKPDQGGKVAGGKCGSGSGGEPTPGEPEATNGAKGRTTADLDRARRGVAQAIADAASKNAGTIPGSFLRMAEVELTPPKVRWETKLSHALRSSVANMAGRVDYSRARVNRRQGAYNAAAASLGMRAPLMPALVAPIPEVAIGIDTSGSMDSPAFAHAFSESKAILQAIGAPATFLACDTECTTPVKVRDIREIKRHLKGGGGTDFHPVFAAVSKLRPRPSIFVFITDGCGPAPAEAPKGYRTIWLLTGKGATAPVKWGEQIAVDDK